MFFSFSAWFSYGSAGGEDAYSTTPVLAGDAVFVILCLHGALVPCLDLLLGEDSLPLCKRNRDILERRAAKSLCWWKLC